MQPGLEEASQVSLPTVVSMTCLGPNTTGDGVRCPTGSSFPMWMEVWSE